MLHFIVDHLRYGSTSPRGQSWFSMIPFFNRDFNLFVKKRIQVTSPIERDEIDQVRCKMKMIRYLIYVVYIYITYTSKCWENNFPAAQGNRIYLVWQFRNVTFMVLLSSKISIKTHACILVVLNYNIYRPGLLLLLFNIDEGLINIRSCITNISINHTSWSTDVLARV